MESPSHIGTLLKILARFNPEAVAEDDAYRLKFENDAKTVNVIWPTEASEVFFDFTMGGELLLAESVEYYENETELEQTQDVASIVQNFLVNEVKLAESGTFLRRKELQSFRGGKWLSVFKPVAQ